MRKLTYILFLAVIALACNRDDLFEGAAISFYPEVIGSGLEEDGNTYVITLATSAEISSPGKANIEVKMSSEGVISTVPPMNGNTIELEVTNNEDAYIYVTLENDQVPDDYTAEFIINSVSGSLAGIGSNKYTMYVFDSDIVTIEGSNFDDCPEIGDITTYSVTGDQEWDCTGFGLNGQGFRMNGYSGGNLDNEDWMLAGPYDLSAYPELSVSFYSDVAFTGPGLELMVSTDYESGDPSNATWSSLEANYDASTANDSWTYSGNVDISAYKSATTTVAIVYTSTTSGAAQWTIDEFSINIFHPNASGGGNANLVSIPFSDDFEDCDEDLSAPANFDVKYGSGSKNDRGWVCRSNTGVDGSGAVRINTLNGNVGTSDVWLITKNKFDLTNTTASISFDVQSTGSGDGDLEVYYSTDYFGEEPELGTWIELTDISDQLPAKGSSSYNTILSSIPSGKPAYVAFRFSGSSDLNSASYDIDNFLIDDFSNSFVLPFTDDFESCDVEGEYNTPTKWFEENVPGFNTDRGWGCRSFGVDDTWAPRASAFVGSTATGEDDSWMISNGKIDLTSVSTVNLSFYAKTQYSGPGRVRFYWSSNYAGAGDPTAATWTELTDVTSQMESITSSFSEITGDLSGAAGNEVYVAFRYTEGTASSSIAIDIDDLSITGN